MMQVPPPSTWKRKEMKAAGSGQLEEALKMNDSRTPLAGIRSRYRNMRWSATHRSRLSSSLGDRPSRKTCGFVLLDRYVQLAILVVLPVVELGASPYMDYHSDYRPCSPVAYAAVAAVKSLAGTSVCRNRPEICGAFMAALASWEYLCGPVNLVVILPS